MIKDVRGAAAVEMAISFVLLAWLIFGIVDVGRAIFTQIAVRDAAQSGASYAAFTETAATGDVEAQVILSNDALSLTATEIDVACQTVTRSDQNASQVRVTVRYALDLITPLVGNALGGTIDLEHSAEAERYFSSCAGLQEVSW